MNSWKKATLVFLGLPLLFVAALLGWQAWQRHRLVACLPAGVSLSSQATSGPLVMDSSGLQLLGLLGFGKAAGQLRLPTVEEELKRFGAFPRDGKLYTAQGEEIVLYIDDPRVDYEPHHFDGKTVIVVAPLGGECELVPESN